MLLQLLVVIDLTHSFPFVGDILGGEAGVRVDSRQFDAIGLSDLQDLAVNAQCGHALLVSLGQSGLELVVSGDQTLEEEQKRLRTRFRVFNKKCFLSLLPFEWT